MKELKRVYLAGPYSHSSPGVRERRAKALNAECARMMSSGDVCVFSPITHGHALLEHLPYGERTWEFWGRQDKSHLMTCDELHVLCLEGWDTSRGVADEIAWAQAAGMPVIYREGSHESE